MDVEDWCSYICGVDMKGGGEGGRDHIQLLALSLFITGQVSIPLMSGVLPNSRALIPV